MGKSVCELLIIFPNSLLFFRLIAYRLTAVRPFNDYNHNNHLNYIILRVINNNTVHYIYIYIHIHIDFSNSYSQISIICNVFQSRVMCNVIELNHDSPR